LRVISGSARGRRLHRPAGSRVRPTADRVKEALFSTLTSRFGSFDGLIVLDLFAGSGGLGIEALSRGAARAVFVDCHPDSIALTKSNLLLTGLADSATLVMMEASKALKRFSAEGMIFDIIVVDPPYSDIELTLNILKLLAELAPLTASGVIVFEAGSRSEPKLPDIFHLCSRKVYGDTALTIFDLAK